MTQETLVRGIALMSRTDEDVIESAVHEHSRLVYRIAYSVLRNHHDAEDATQETFMRVLRYRRRLEGVQNAKTWLARIAWRVAVARSKRHLEVSMSEQEICAVAEEVTSQMISAEENALANETERLLNQLIAALPAQQRDALRLSTVEELTHSEIADVLGTSESSVRSRIFRARQILKEKLAALESNYGSKR
ncbi:MAG TPA: RNA polymerase sigma factor [Terriglobales bacterium]